MMDWQPWMAVYAAITVPLALIVIGVGISLKRRNWRAGEPVENPEQPGPRAFGA